VSVRVEFCGETYDANDNERLVIGREGNIVVDDNPYLHRRFLEISPAEGLWWLANVGSQLTATVADEQGLLQAWLAPGAQIPLVFAKTIVWFTAGPTTYEFEVTLDLAPFSPIVGEIVADGSTTIGRTNLTTDQRLLVLALAEQALRRGNRGVSAIPSSADAAQRLGWTLTKFNRKLDNVCEKFERMGVRGLHGGAARLAANRRARLVEYALAARVVTTADLMLLNGVGDVTHPE
jgi:hypothetical protein